MRSLGLLLFLVWMGACSSPMASIQNDISTFEREMPKNFYLVNGRHRQIRAAWAGNPSHPPILLIHGSPGLWKAWAHFLLNPNLVSRFHVIAVDRPGFGGSGAGVAEPSLTNQAEDIAEVLQNNVSGERAILVGHSLGGPVAAELAMLFPQKVSGLILVASSVAPTLEKTKWFQIPAQYPPLGWIVPTDLRTCNQEILALKSELERMERGWPKLSLPVALIHGQDDDLVPVANVDFVEARLAKEQLVSVQRIPGLNHYVPWKRPDLILQAIYEIQNFLSLKNQGATKI